MNAVSLLRLFGGLGGADSAAILVEIARRLRSGGNEPVFLAMLEENRGVHKSIFQYYKELGLMGRVVLVDGALAGYTFGYSLNNETFCVLVEVVNLSIKGLSVFIFSSFCTDAALRSFKYINVIKILLTQ